MTQSSRSARPSKPYPAVLMFPHGWMLRQREAQSKTGRIIPQVNEEYGYEDHYLGENVPGRRLG